MKTKIPDINPIDVNLENSHFAGNTNLRPAGVPMTLTAEQVTEYLHCADDPIYFIKKYVKITSLDEGIIPFDLWDFQENFVNTMIESRFTIAKFPRQSGKTQSVAAFFLHSILFQSNWTAGVLANKMEQAVEILARIQMSYENLPKWIQQGVIGWNVRSIHLENGSGISAFATSSTAIRGRSLNCVYLDEFAHIDGSLQRKFYTSTYPVISSGKMTKIIITSTPNGMEMFFKLWQDAIKKANDFTPISVGWWDIPGRNEAWKLETIANTSKEQFNQEYNCAFLGSSDTLIDPDVLAKLAFIKPIRIMSESSPLIKVFKEAEDKRLYSVIVDTARGVSGDYSAILVIDITKAPYEVVATYHDNTIRPESFCPIIDHVAKVYNDAFVLIENNDLGEQVSNTLFADYETDNLLYTSKAGTGKKTQILGGAGTNPVPGVVTTKPVKRRGCFAMKGLVENQQVILNSEDLVNELYTFIKDVKGSHSAQAGNHDDLTMCLVLFSWMTTEDHFKSLMAAGGEAWNNIKNRMKKQVDEMGLVFGEIDDGRNGAEYSDNMALGGIYPEDLGQELEEDSWWKDTNRQNADF